MPFYRTFCCRCLVQYVTLVLGAPPGVALLALQYQMEDTIHALGEIVLRGLPTFFLLLLLHFYLKRMFFVPLDKVLADRFEATTGARKQAEAAIARAEAKAQEYEDAIRAARTEVYKDNEAMRKQWRERQAVMLAGARAKADTMIAVAKAEMAGDVRAARETLQADSDRIADGIVAAILRRTA